MNEDSIDDDSINKGSLNSSPTNRDALEKNLINALTRLQHTAFDTAFLDDKTNRVDELPPESFLGFVIGQYHFIVRATCFCEVFVDTPIAAVPNAPECLAGLSNIRGVLMPIYQLHSGLKLNFPKKMTIFCIGKGEAAIGLLVDELPSSLSLSVSQRKAQIGCKDALLLPLIKTSYFFNQREWLLVNGQLIAEQLQKLAANSFKFSASVKNAHDSRNRENTYL
jgi:chemotaxis signal transduction protein